MPVIYFCLVGGHLFGGGGVLDERLGACLRKFLLKYTRIKDHDWQEENQS